MKCYYFESNEEFSCNLKIIMKNYHYDTTLRSVNDTGERMKNKNLRVYCLFSSEIVEDGKTGPHPKGGLPARSVRFWSTLTRRIGIGMVSSIPSLAVLRNLLFSRLL